MEFKDKTAQIISEALNMAKGDDLVKYSNIMMYIKGLEKEYFEGKSPLNADTIYELYKNYCDEYMTENFCAKMYYFKKFNDFKIYDEEPLNLGKKRILELYKALEDNDKNSKEEYSKLCQDPEYQSFLRQRRNHSIKKENFEVKLLDYALEKKETTFNKYIDAHNTVKDYICELFSGKDKKEISKELKTTILTNFKSDAIKLMATMTM